MITKCNVCGSRVNEKFSLDFKNIFGLFPESYTQRVAVCPKCQLIFTMNPFSDDQLADRYKNFSKYEFDSSYYVLDEDEISKMRSVRQKEFLERTVGISSLKSILEIGAASGYNLSLYRNDCYTFGVEPSKGNCEVAKKLYDVDMFCGTFKEYADATALNRKSFDLVFLSHVLEHIVNPCDFIKELSVFDSKYMFIEVPTIDYKWVDEPYGIFCEEHVNIFTLAALQSLMVTCGYKLINADICLNFDILLPAGVPHLATVWEKQSAASANKIYKSSFHSEELLTRYVEKSAIEFERVKKIIDSIDENTKLAVWGTGHHASMLLANTSLANKNIVRVYDSDLRKSGMIFNGVKVQPFNEADVTNKDIDAVLVATYTAQKAICKILEKHCLNLKVISLYDI